MLLFLIRGVALLAKKTGPDPQDEKKTEFGVEILLIPSNPVILSSFIVYGRKPRQVAAIPRAIAQAVGSGTAAAASTVASRTASLACPP
jgi:hypothetical protein